jgi:hypothetical protein
MAAAILLSSMFNFVIPTTVGIHGHADNGDCIEAIS